ncbi:membrane protein [Geothrix limicola]|uniref:Membrane protein n=1 Tax=Geothrix limicola TaxID=2927978 RepID=A0ABQ5QDG3_9BACT|nr:DoxX family protein [Geothrix limicola]GLH72698.1 membrane protein [Geothrix limicola]
MPSTSTPAIWTGRVLSTLPILFLLFDGVVKVLRLPPVLEGTAKLGYPLGVVVPLGLTLLVCTVLYAIPRTSVLGAIFLTGYLGGAVASHVRVGDPLFSHALFPTYFAVLIWGGLFLRDARLRALLPFARPLA